MDPTECMYRIAAAIDVEDRDEAVEALRDLADWLEKGGFYPAWSVAKQLAK